ncbi:MAG: group II intron reverse transcriptase/maturase [Desulfomonilaceae bacterium]
MPDRQPEEQPTPVSCAQRGTKPAGKIRDRWSWVEPSVWTNRMLTALENGVRGGKWYSLMDKVCSPGNLRAAFAKVKANGGSPGIDRVPIEMFETRLEDHLGRMAETLRAGTYRPQAIERVWIPKPGTKEKRPLGIPTVRDRVVQAALRNVLEPIFEKDFAAPSYGFRPGRGCKDALRQVDALLKQGYTFVVDADLKSYFDTIPHAQLMARLREKIADAPVLALIDSFLKQRVMDTAKGWTPETGTPQGAVLSPLLSNIYLDPLDHLMAEAGIAMVRYADDFVILCGTEAHASAALALVQQWTAAAGLTLHPTKTRIVDAARPGGFDFLGYHFERGRHWPRPKSLKKLKASIRARTRRTNGYSLCVTILNVNQTLRGWFGYFQHSPRSTFERLDGWIRMRMRSILRKRRGGRGRGRGADHQRWPNAYFAEQGLYFLTTAHALACQSARR